MDLAPVGLLIGFLAVAVTVGVGYFIRRWARRLSRTVKQIEQLFTERTDLLLGEVARSPNTIAAQFETISATHSATMEKSFNQVHHALGAKTTELLEQLTLALEASLARLEMTRLADQRRRMDRMQSDLDFVKNHMASYLGNGTGLTHLIDETPIYVNTDDFGCPANFINGGRYEEDYYQVLASFRKPDSVFLDIGANLGVFSLRMAPLLRKGHVYAFEPNAQIHELLSRSIHLNGLKHLVQVLKVGASDHNAELLLAVPEGHAGGASVVALDSHLAGQKIAVRRIDEVLADLPVFSLAKIDVEGHELQALRGMMGLLKRSPAATILFEKLSARSGVEADLLDLLHSVGMLVYRIDGVTLVPADLQMFEASEAYFLAAKPLALGGELNRNFLTIYPADVYAIACEQSAAALSFHGEVEANTVVFHGPYWYLPRGSYHLQIAGKVSSGLKLQIAEKFGYPVAEFEASPARTSLDFIVERDLTQFEIVGRAPGGSLSFDIESLRLTRLG